MRVIAGALKGRRLAAPDWEGLRPTSDKLRGTLFNILAPRVRGARVLDGYAGTGAVGIEALSRGAAHVTFVERDPRAARLIAANLAHCGVADRHAIIRVGFASVRGALPAGDFDLVFLDPPYGAAELGAALETAAALGGPATAASDAPVVRPDALLIVEHARRDPAPEAAGVLRRTRTVESGDSALSFYCWGDG